MSCAFSHIFMSVYDNFDELLLNDNISNAFDNNKVVQLYQESGYTLKQSQMMTMVLYILYYSGL